MGYLEDLRLAIFPGFLATDANVQVPRKKKSRFFKGKAEKQSSSKVPHPLAKRKICFWLLKEYFFYLLRTLERKKEHASLMPILKGLDGKFGLSFLFGVGSPEDQKAPEMLETRRKYQPAQKNATDI